MPPAKPRKKAESVDDLLNDDTETETPEPAAAADDLLNPDAKAFVDDDDDLDSLNINLDDIDESQAKFQPIPADTYESFIEVFEDKVSQAGNKMISVRYKVVGGDYANRTLFDNFVLNNEIGRARLKVLLIATGLASEGSLNLKDIIRSGSAIGTRCRVKVVIRMQNGEKRNNVTEVMPSSEEDPFFS